LPVVIFAATALLLFKGIGLVTGGGYVLTGMQPAVAAEAASDGTAAAADSSAAGSDAAAAGADGADTPSGPTIADPSPTLADDSPTLATSADPAQAPVSGADAAPGKPSAAPPPDPGSVAALTAAGVLPGPDARAVPVCPPSSGTNDDSASGAAPGGKTSIPGVNCDALASQVGPTGQALPIAAVGNVSPTEQKLIDRLNQRSTDLDKLAGSLATREAVIQAAEKQMQARADALKSLQDQIQALQDQKKSMQGTQFAGVVKMYETMKPQQAAAIFDGLDMGVLIRVAEAMDPRKMSAVLAQMSSVRAQQLTTQMAADDPAAGDQAAATPDPGALPQIVGR
jgi:flagellar motility protein MotE (MotC chaperone)